MAKFMGLRAVYHDTSARSKLLIVPLIVFELIVFIVPFLYLVRMSLYGRASGRAFVPDTLAIEGFQTALGFGYTRRLIVYTFTFAVIATIISVLVSMFYAYALWRAKTLLKTILLSAVTFALLTTLVVKIFAVFLVLSPNGIINRSLLGLSVISEPLLIVNTTFGVVLGQVYINVPYATLAIWGVLETMKEDAFDAALDLGANRPRAFYEVVLPHAVPGLIVATVISFAWSIGAYTSPLIIGRGPQRTIALQIEEIMLTQFDWPTAAALSLIVLTFVLVTLLAAAYLSRRLKGEVEYV